MKANKETEEKKRSGIVSITAQIGEDSYEDLNQI